MFAESFVNGDGSFPQNINKTQNFRRLILMHLKQKLNPASLIIQVEIDPVTGEYVYYGSTDWYGELYKKTYIGTDNNISVSGSGDKATYLDFRQISESERTYSVIIQMIIR